MKQPGGKWINAPLRNDCYAFLRDDAKSAVSELLSAAPDAAKLLDHGALKDLEDDYINRISSILMSVIINDARSNIKETDFQEFISLSGNNTEVIDAAFEKVREDILSDGGKALRNKYFLSAGYESAMRASFIASKAEFLSRFIADKGEIEAEFFDGRSIRKIAKLSSDGADSHRHGRNVMGVTTDAGRCFYKPHNCSLDAFYREVVQTWFPDRTIAPAVIDRGSYAFVSALEHRDLSSREGINRFWFNFGSLTALFHALGSTDMHCENIMSCGEFPCALDLETILSCIKSSGSGAPFAPADDYRYSALICGAFPSRIHLGGVISPLYTEINESRCLPRFSGEAFTVSGYEEVFIDGFRDGYSRILSHRGEIIPMLMKYTKSTIRIVPRNTMYYGIVRAHLMTPEALSDPAKRDKAINELRIPYEINGKPADEEIFSYEKSCLMEGDIPYYCTGIDTCDLCGEDTDHIIRQGYNSETAAGHLRKRLGRLSERERIFEEELIRAVLMHAPLDDGSEADVKHCEDCDTGVGTPDHAAGDTETDAVKASVTDSRASDELASELAEILSALEREALHHTDGVMVSWKSTAADMEYAPSCGLLTMWADVLMFCALTIKTDLPDSLKSSAMMLAECCLQGFRAYTEVYREKEDLLKDMPRGLGTGLGEILLALDLFKEAAGEAGDSGKAGSIGGFGETVASEVREILKYFINALQGACAHHQSYMKTKRNTCSPWNIMSGSAGLIIACSLISTEVSPEIIRSLADDVLEGLPAEKIGGLEGAAGMGAALAYAYHVTGDERYAKGCDEAFGQLHASYSSYYKGWISQKNQPGWAGRRQPLSAGIALAASYSMRYTDLDIVSEVLSDAAGSMADQKDLLSRDSLSNGSALTVLACLMLPRDRGRFSVTPGMPEMKDRAESILHAMIKRKEKTGSFNVSPEGVRSTFDPSFAFGTVGIGCVIALCYGESCGRQNINELI